MTLSNHKVSPAITSILAIVWAFSAIITFLNKFYEPLFLLAKLGRFFLVGFLIILVIAFGRSLLQIARIFFANALENILFSYVVGSLIGGYFLFALVAIFGVNKSIYSVALLIIGGIAARNVRLIASELRETARACFQKLQPILTQGGWLPGSGCALVISLTFVIILAPPFFYDVVVYHYGFPNYYIQSGGYHYNPDILQSNWPQLVQQWFMMLLCLDGYLSANMWHFFYLPLNLLALTAFIRFFNRSPVVAFYSIVFFVVSPLIFQLSAIPFIELALSLYTLSAMLAMLRFVYHRQNPKSYLILSGISAGAACAVKYTALLFSCGPVFAVLMAGIFRKMPVSRVLRQALLWGFIAGVSGSVFYVRTWINTGNPVYPMAYTLLGGTGWSVEQTKALFTGVPLFHMDSAQSVPELVMDFFDKTLGQVWRMSVQPGTRTAEISGLQFIAFVPFILMCLHKKKLRLIIVIGLVFLFLWLTNNYVFRYFAPLLGLFAFMGAYAWLKLLHHREPLLKLLLSAGLGLILFVNVWSILIQFGRHEPLKVAINAESESEYLSRKLASYPAIEYVNKLDQPVKVLFVGDEKSFYCTRSYVCNTTYNYNPLIVALGHSNSIDDVKRQLKKDGFTHIIVNFQELERLILNYNYTRGLPPEKAPMLPEFWRRACRPVFTHPQNSNVLVLEILD